MWDWLLSPIDAARPHHVDLALAWHGRVMVLAWGILAPLAVLAARYFKVMPGQDWPRELDNQTWWRSHWIGHMSVLGLSVIGLVLVLPLQFAEPRIHGILGTSVLAGLAVQIGLGVFRGSKGGPTAPAADGSLRGDHFDMTPRRRLFEALHKTLGYTVLILAAVTVIYGLWHANGPVWMWCILIGWWICLAGLAILFQRKGMALGSYQAIWGDDPSLPGNATVTKGNEDVRSDRRHRV